MSIICTGRLSAARALLATSFACASLLVAPLSTGAETRVSKPFEYAGYSSPQFTGQQRLAVFIPMTDGTQLAATVYLPDAGPSDEKFPVLLWYLPGHRESIDPKTGELRPYGSPEQIRYFNSHGYAWVIAEMRGSGASFGKRFDRGPQIGKDGKDLVDWLAKQSWSSGAVGMVGLSYQGFSQYATAAQRPAALKAIFPEIAGFDEYSIMFYPGGIQNIAMSSFAAANIARDDQNVYLAAPPQGPPVLPSAPVVDEDGDGQLVDEIPIDKNGNGTFLDDGEPAYSDGNQRNDIYFRASREHLDNINLTSDLITQAPFRDSVLPGSALSYADLGPASKPADIAASGIAVYNRAGWFDYHARCATQWFTSLAGHTPARLLIAPTAHGGFAGGRSTGGPYWKMFDVPQNEAAQDVEKLRFFDRYLKNIDNGFDREPPVYLYVMGKGWRTEKEWPLRRAKSQRFYLAAGKALAAQQDSKGADAFKVDFTADSRHQGANRWNYRLMNASEPMQFASVDAKRTQYDTPVLTADMEVTGHPTVDLMLSSTASDGDFFVYLEDIDENGKALVVTEGQLRASFHKLVANDSIVTTSPFNVRPELPWHGYRKADQDASVFANGRSAQLKIDFMPTAWVFRKGHRIRLSIAGADWPTFALHPLLAPGNKPDDPQNTVPTVTIHRAASYVELPVIPVG